MSDYWRARRAAEREEKVMKDFYIFIRCLLDKKPTPNIIMTELTRLTQELGLYDDFRTRDEKRREIGLNDTASPATASSSGNDNESA